MVSLQSVKNRPVFDRKTLTKKQKKSKKMKKNAKKVQKFAKKDPFSNYFEFFDIFEQKNPVFRGELSNYFRFFTRQKKKEKRGLSSRRGFFRNCIFFAKIFLCFGSCS